MMLLMKAKNHEALVTLANALLLGHISREVEFLEGRRFRLAIRQPLPPELTLPTFSRIRSIRDLFEVLNFSNALAPEISEIYDSHDQCLSDRPLFKYKWIQSIFKQAPEIATISLDGFPFLKIQTDWNDFRQILEQASPDELRTPVARLQPTEATKAAEYFIITYFRILLTHAIRIGRAEGQQTGWDRVRDRLSALRLPDRASKDAIMTRKHGDEKGWLEQVRAKANRLFLEPLIDRFDRKPCDYDLIAMSKYAISLWPFTERDEPEFMTHLGNLGARICEQSISSQPEFENHFPPDEEFRRQNLFNVEADADPAEFLHFAQEQVGWLALRKGWALCIAEDVLPDGDSTLSRASPDRFAPLHASVRIVKPAELDIYRWGELNEKARRMVGASRLWFVLTHELAEFQASASPAGGSCSVSKNRSERAAQKVINRLHAKHPDARMVKGDAVIALTSFGFKQKAAGRIWDNSAAERWKVAGKPPSGIKRLSPGELLQALQKSAGEVQVISAPA